MDIFEDLLRSIQKLISIIFVSTFGCIVLVIPGVPADLRLVLIVLVVVLAGLLTWYQRGAVMPGNLRKVIAIVIGVVLIGVGVQMISSDTFAGIGAITFAICFFVDAFTSQTPQPE